MEFISSVEHDSSRVSALICYINTIYSVTQTNKRNDFSQLYFKRTERKCRKRNKLLTTPFQGRFQKYSYKFQIVQIKFRNVQMVSDIATGIRKTLNEFQIVQVNFTDGQMKFK